MAKPKASKTPPAGTTNAPPLTDEAIAIRAYEISLGEAAGSPEENWLQAEQELRVGTGEQRPTTGLSMLAE